MLAGDHSIFVTDPKLANRRADWLPLQVVQPAFDRSERAAGQKKRSGPTPRLAPRFSEYAFCRSPHPPPCNRNRRSRQGERAKAIRSIRTRGQIGLRRLAIFLNGSLSALALRRTAKVVRFRALAIISVAHALKTRSRSSLSRSGVQGRRGVLFISSPSAHLQLSRPDFSQNYLHLSGT